MGSAWGREWTVSQFLRKESRHMREGYENRRSERLDSATQRLEIAAESRGPSVGTLQDDLACSGRPESGRALTQRSL